MEHSVIFKGWDCDVDANMLGKILCLNYEPVVCINELTERVCLSRLHKIIVQFNGGTNKVMLLKTESSISMANSFAAKFNFYGSEVVFYNDMASRCHAKVPHCYFSSISPGRDKYSLLLDFAPSKSSCVGMDLNMAELKAAIFALGKFHGSYFDLEENKVSSTCSLSMFNVASALPTFVEKWKSIIEEFADEETKENEVLEVINHCANYPSNYLSLLQMGSPSLIHGNYCAENLIGSENENDVTIIDFQTIYSGMFIFSLIGSSRLRLNCVCIYRWRCCAGE